MNRIRTLSGVLGALCRCLDCGWELESRTNTLANAKRHAKAYGHTVQAEQTIGVTYTPEDSEYYQTRAK